MMSNLVAPTILVLALALRVSGQCDPTVCANPGAFQELSPSSHMLQSKKYLTNPEDDGTFESFGATTYIPAVPDYWDPTIFESFQVTMDATFVPKPDTPEYTDGNQPLHMETNLMLAAPNLDPTWSFQLNISIGSRHWSTPPMGVADQALRASFNLYNYPEPNQGYAPGLQIWVVPDYGNTIVLDTGVVPYTLTDVTVKVGMIVIKQPNTGPLNDTTCQALPPPVNYNDSGNTNGTEFDNLALSTSHTIIPIDFTPSFTPVNPWCNLSVVVLNDINTVLIDWFTPYVPPFPPLATTDIAATATEETEQQKRKRKINERRDGRFNRSQRVVSRDSHKKRDRSQRKPVLSAGEIRNPKSPKTTKTNIIRV